MNEILIHIEAEIYPSEDLKKVKKAVNNIFGSVEFELKPKNMRSLFIAKSNLEGLSKLRNLLRKERIRDAARNVFFERLNEKSITFYLNKQVAYMGHISFSKPVSESPLGPIRVQIRSDNPRKLIDWLAPKTSLKVG